MSDTTPLAQIVQPEPSKPWHRRYEAGLEPNLRRLFRFIGFGEGVELAIIGGMSHQHGLYGNPSCWPTTEDEAIRLAEDADAKSDASGVFIVSGVIGSTWAERPKNEWTRVAIGGATGNQDIVQRRMMFADFDPERGDESSSTDDELKAAEVQARKALGFLADQLGNDTCLGLAMSGNGMHVCVALDVEDSEEVDDLVWGILNGLKSRFETPAVKVDLTVCNAARKSPAYGTFKRKGTHGTDERPWRRSWFRCPENPTKLDLAQLRNLHRSVAVPNVSRATKQQGTYDADSHWGAMAAVPVEDVAARVGIDPNDPKCPNCGKGDAKKRDVCFLTHLGRNQLKCLHGVHCTQPAYGPIGLVAKVVFQRDTLKGDRDLALKIEEWFAREFNVVKVDIPDTCDVDGMQVTEDDFVDECVSDVDETTEPPADSDRTVPPPPPKKPVILVGTDQMRVNNEGVQALGRARNLFSRSKKLVRLLSERGAAVTISPIQVTTLSEILADAADWRAMDARGNVHSAHPPMLAVKTIHAREYWAPLRPLVAVVEHPVMRPDGTWISEPGYDADTGIVFMPVEGVEFLAPAKNPTHDDAKAAVAELLDVVSDFPFASPEHRTAWLAGVLDQLCAYALNCPAPVKVIDANVRGAGKTLLAQVAAIIATGRRIAPSKFGDDEEMRKAITSWAIAGRRGILLDNVRGFFGGASMELVTTARRWLDRLLGGNESGEWPVAFNWWVTANNIEIGGDMPRRCIHIRLESDQERPEDRESFRHPDVEEYALANRARLFRAAQTILTAYVQAGRPAQGCRLGSFQGWADLVAGALVWCGEPDPCKTRLALEEAGSSDVVKLHAIMDAWAAVFGSQALKAADVIQLIEDEDRDKAGRKYQALKQVLREHASGRKGLCAQSLGRKLGHFRGRVSQGLKFVQVDGQYDSHSKVQAWSLVAADGSQLPQPDVQDMCETDHDRDAAEAWDALQRELLN